MIHRIVKDCNTAICNWCNGTNFTNTNDPIKIWNDFHVKYIPPTIVEAISNFFFHRTDLSDIDKFIVYGLTITETNPEQHQEFWNNLFGINFKDGTSRSEAPTTKAQVAHMGIAVQSFIKETGIEETVLKNYYGVEDSGEISKTSN